MPPHIAFLAMGQLYLHEDQGDPRLFESPFAAEVLRRHHEIQKRHAWKTEGRGARFMMGGMAWEMPEESRPGFQKAFLMSLTKGCGEGELLYGLRVADVHGICRLKLEGRQESRLIHEQGHLPDELSAGAGHPLIACAVSGKDGSSAIALMDHEGGQIREITEGDSQDGAPSWVEGSATRLVFQSAGIGRNGHGDFIALGPSAIHRLDVEKGEMEVLLASDHHDFLAPRMRKDGTLFCIRRPYAAHGKPRFVSFAVDILKAPFRLLGALFQYLNFFSASYTGKPLISASGGRKGADWRRLTLLANRLDAQDEGARADEPLVPKNWALLQVAPGGSQRVLAEHALAYDMGADGRLIYTTGTAIFALEEGGEPRQILRHPAIQRVVAL